MNIINLQNNPGFVEEYFDEEIVKKEKLVSNNLPVDTINKILQCCGLTEINKMMLLNKNWNKFIKNNKVFLCERILNKFANPKDYRKIVLCEKVVYNPLVKDEKIMDTITLTKKHMQTIFTYLFKKCFPTQKASLSESSTFLDIFNKAGSDRVPIFNESLIRELNELLANPKIENFHEFLNICKARDTLVFWKYLQCQLDHNHQLIGGPIDNDILNITSIKELLDMAKEFQKWCEINRDNLSLVPSISLNRNYLTSVPKEISLLKNLIKLNLSFNYFQSLPAEIGQLKELQHLDLTDNHLTSLSSVIGQLTKLTTLNLFGNTLSSLPDEIYKLNDLCVLDLYGNKLTSVSPKIGRLKKLTSLILESNPLNSLPKVLKSNVGLRLEESKKEDPNFWSDEKDDEKDGQWSFSSYTPNSCMIQ